MNQGSKKAKKEKNNYSRDLMNQVLKENNTTQIFSPQREGLNRHISFHKRLTFSNQ